MSPRRMSELHEHVIPILLALSDEALDSLQAVELPAWDQAVIADEARRRKAVADTFREGVTPAPKASEGE